LHIVAVLLIHCDSATVLVSCRVLSQHNVDDGQAYLHCLASNDMTAVRFSANALPNFLHP